MRTSAWQPLCSTSGDSAMSREKPSAAAGPSSVSLSRPRSCVGESPELGTLLRGLPSWERGERAGSAAITQPHDHRPCPSGGSSGGGSAAPGLWSPVQAKRSAPGWPPALAHSHAQGRPYPEQQRERLHSVGPLCKAGLHCVHRKLQDLIQLLPWGDGRDRLSHSSVGGGQGPALSCPAPLPAGCLFTSPAKHLAAVVAVKGQLHEQLSASSSRRSRSC